MRKFNPIKLRRDTKSILLFGVIVVILSIAGYIFLSKPYVPPSFNEVRQQSAEIAKKIVAINDQSLKNLDRISIYDRHYDFQKALELVQEELKNAKKSRQIAVELTNKLDEMVKIAMGITPAKTRELAIKAISSELSLISHLIVYNDTLNGLLQTLKFKFSGDIQYDTEDVQILIKNMNSEIREINKLNDAFNENMKEFDETTNKS